jgi:2,5-diamino-6-(ribosylamino)-4(3H)-pyrimidinone 5'-phosphate reductase
MPPYVTVNCAMSADGKIALPSRRQTRISSEEDIARVHRLRNQNDAILVGIGTVLADDPSLLVKGKYVRMPRRPLRIVLDSRGRTPANAKVTSAGAPTLIVMTREPSVRPWPDNVETVVLGDGGRVPIARLLDELDGRKIKSLLVEGGSEVIWSFLKEGAVDRLNIFVGSLVLGGAGPTPAGGEGASRLEDAFRLRLAGTRRLGDGVLLVYEPER